MTWLVAILAALILGFAFGRYRTYVFQNRGEARLSRALKQRFGPPNYHLLNHLTLHARNGTTQIDHVLVSRFGVFVIETKDYSGWIFASPGDRSWTQVLFRSRYRFQNPLHQNHGHTRVVQELLDFLPPEAVVPMVVFTGNAKFKTTVPDDVFTLGGCLADIEHHTAEVMSANRLQFCVGRLETSRLAVTKRTDIEHVERLRRRFGIDE